MTVEEYFGDWCPVIDLKEADRILRKLRQSKTLCPTLKDIFKAFRLCSMHNLRVVVIGDSPYSEYMDRHPVATGIAFANASNTPKGKYSHSLEVLRESVIDFTIPHGNVIFDPSLEKWEEQGVLLLNASLSCDRGTPCSHTLLWRPFITSLIIKLSEYAPGIVYVLMGSSQSLEPYIGKNNHVIRCRHPSGNNMLPSSIWREIDNILIGQNGYGIEWYNKTI